MLCRILLEIMAHSKNYLAWIQSPEWKAKSKKCQSWTKYHCIVFPWLKSRHCHHLTYKNMKNEVPIRDIVPLSKIAHSIIHWRIFWKSPLRPWANTILRVLMVLWVIFWMLPIGKK